MRHMLTNKLYPYISRSRVCWKFMNRGITSIFTADPANCASDTVFSYFSPADLAVRLPTSFPRSWRQVHPVTSDLTELRINLRSKYVANFGAVKRDFRGNQSSKAEKRCLLEEHFFFVRKKEIFIDHFGAFNSIS